MKTSKSFYGAPAGGGLGLSHSTLHIVLVGCVWLGLGTRAAQSGQLARDTNFTAAVFRFIEQSEYNIRWIDSQAVYKAANRAQNLRFTLFADGFAVEPRDYGEGNARPWQITLRLQGFGKASTLARPVRGEHWEVDRNMASAVGVGIILEYLNTKEGLRQSFRIQDQPEGKGPVQLVLELDSHELGFVVDGQKNEVVFVGPNQKEVARYFDLNVWDATQRPLAAYMSKLDETRFAIVVDDTDAVYPVLVDPLVAEWGVSGTQSGAKFGYSVAWTGQIAPGSEPVGVIVGAPYFDTGQYVNAGKVFVYFDGAELPENPSWTKEGDQAYGYFGWSVAGCGNVYGSTQERFDDIIIGTPYYDSGGYYDNGKVFIFAGSANGLGFNPVWTAANNQSYAHLGWSVCGIRDINGDGYDEIAFGVPDYDYNGATDTGIVYVYAGGQNGPTFLNTLFGSGGTRFGFSLSAIAYWEEVNLLDVNGDNIADLVVGAPYWSTGGSTPGAVRVFFGSQNGFGASYATLYGTGNGDRFGFSVAAVGDTDGDGYGDVLVGAPLHDNGQTDEGKAYLFRGNANGINTTASWTVESNQAGAQLGYSVAGGPVDGEDWLSDLAIGVPYYDTTSLNLTNNGEAWFYRGVQDDLPTLDARVIGTGSNDHNGWSVAYSPHVQYRSRGIIVGAPDAAGGGTTTACYWRQ
jgi:hypothetical protein